jgi:hypothetical protein
MKLHKIENIHHASKDIPLYYRNDYQAQGHFISKQEGDVFLDFGFSVETLSTGHKHVNVQIYQDINYPLVPILKALKSEILNLDEKGLLH